MRSTGRDIVAMGNVTGTVIAIVLRFLSGRKLPCLLYRPLLRQLALADVEKLHRAKDPPKYQQMPYFPPCLAHRSSPSLAADSSSFLYSFSCCSCGSPRLRIDCFYSCR